MCFLFQWDYRNDQVGFLFFFFLVGSTKSYGSKELMGFEYLMSFELKSCAHDISISINILD